MSDKKPLASILIDHYNSRDLVGETIESALAQDYEPKEIILVDDGSTDGSKDVLSHFESRIRIIYQENRGQNGALNRLVEEAKGDVFFFLDGDDLFLPGKVARIMEIYKKLDWQKKIFLFHSLHWKKGEDIMEVQPKIMRDIHRKSVQETLNRLSTPKEAWKHIQRHGFLPFLSSATCGTTMTRSLAHEIFPLPEEAKILSDSFFALAATICGEVYGLQEPLGIFRWHGQNSSTWVNEVIYSNEFVKIRDNYLNRILQKQGLPPIIDYYASSHARPYYRRYLKKGTRTFLWALGLLKRSRSFTEFWNSCKAFGMAIRQMLQVK